MKVCIIGTGYVGLVTGAGLAEMGNDVICVDNNADKIRRLQAGECPIYEPGLEELMISNSREGRLTFTTDLELAVKASSICMIAVGTPQQEDGTANLETVFSVARDIGRAMNGFKVIATKSTVPVGTSEQVKAIIAAETSHSFGVVSNPEFLAQGNAVEDFLEPSRVIIGSDNELASDLMRELYTPFLKLGNPFIFTSIASAELTKYMANAFLATKISFMNEMASLCEQAGADISEVRAGMATDPRIGSQFLNAGLGYGGSCFPKDVKALIQTSTEYGFKMNLLREVDQINQRKRHEFLDKIRAFYSANLSGKNFAVWGLAFKPKTDDMREAPSVDIIQALLAEGATVQAYDPKATESAKRIFGDKVRYWTNAYDALEGADALLLLTEWNEFRRPDFDRIRSLLKAPVIFDGRNQYNTARMSERGFYYHGVGRPVVSPAQVSSPASP